MKNENVTADPWSAKVERGQRKEKMSFLSCMSFLRKQESRRRKSEVGSRKSDVGKSPFVFPPFERGEIGGIIKIKN